jgi:serine/threonine-protein kinase RsbW
MTAPSNVRLTMPARPEGVAVVRQALAGMAEALDFDAAVLADMKMAVSEACTNVVVHAYEDSDGMLEVDMSADDSGLTILVRDHGGGIHPHATPRREVPALGLGLPLIAALSDAFELRGGAAGTEVRMTFLYDRERDPAAANPVTGSLGEDGRWSPEPASDRSSKG